MELPLRSRGNASFYFQSSVQSNPPVYIPGMGIGCKTHRMPWYKWQCFIFTKQKKSTGTKNNSHKVTTDQSSWRHASEEKLKGRSPSDGSAGGNFFPSVTSLFFPYYKERGLASQISCRVCFGFSRSCSETLSLE